MSNKNKKSQRKRESHSSTKDAPAGGITRWQITLGCLLALVLAFYLWTAGSNGVPFIVDIEPEDYYKQVPSTFLFPDVIPHHYGHYNLMADAFAEGRADLLLDPPKELLELSNPRDPELNARWRILDLSIYKDRYYLYFGPVPTLTLFLPLRWIGIGKISEALATVFYCYGLFLCSVYIFLTCIKRYFPNANPVLTAFGILGLGLANAVPYVLRHPSVYEVAISSGAFFSMLALVFIIRAWNGIRFHNWWLLAASFSLGLSIGCRPIYVFSIIFLFSLWLLFTIKQKLTIKASLLMGFSLALPFFGCLAVLLWFNYVRFGSFTDFGIDRQLNATLWDVANNNRFANLLPGLFLRVFCPLQLTDIFPFIRLHQFYPISLPEGYSLEEVSGGFFATSPITLIYLILAGFLAKKLWKSPVFYICAALLVYGGLILFIESYMMFCNSMRYQLDFLPPILLGSIIGCSYIESTIKSPENRQWTRWGFIFLLLFGVVAHILVSLTGFRDTLRRGEPALYFWLEDLNKPISSLLRPFFSGSDSRVLDITPNFATIRFEDGSEGFPLTGEGFHIRFYSLGHTRIALSADFGLFNSDQQATLVFVPPEGQPEETPVEKTFYRRWEIALRPGSNRVSLYIKPISSKPSKDEKVGYLKNLQISPLR